VEATTFKAGSLTGTVQTVENVSYRFLEAGNPYINSRSLD